MTQLLEYDAWYGFTPPASPSISTLPMSDEEMELARAREARRGTFGFGRVLDEPRDAEAAR